MLRHAAIALALAASLTAAAQSSFVEAGLRCHVVAPDTVLVANGRDSTRYVAGHFTVPASIEHDGQAWTVAGIAPEGFSGCYRLTSIELPATLRAIGDRAFEGCLGLESITIPDSVATIGRDILAECNSLRAITYRARAVRRFGSLGLTARYGESSVGSFVIADGVKIVPPGLASHLTAIDSVAIPASVERIGEGAFAFCHSLRRISVAAGNLHYRGDAGYLTTIGADTLVAWPEALQPDSIISLPPGITAIAPQAFAGNVRLAEIDLANGALRFIGRMAFYHTRLLSATVPATVERIGPMAWAACPRLLDINAALGNATYVAHDGILLNRRWHSIEAFPCGRRGTATTPRGVKGIGVGAFAFCLLDSIDIAEGVFEIANAAFTRSPHLASVKLPTTLQRIDKESFADCHSLTAIELPEGVTHIGRMAFAFCTGLRSIVCHGAEPPHLGEGAFYKVTDCNVSAPSEAYRSWLPDLPLTLTPQQR